MKKIIGLCFRLGMLFSGVLMLGSQLCTAATINPELPNYKSLILDPKLPSVFVLDFELVDYPETRITFQIPELNTYEVSAAFDPSIVLKDDPVQEHFLLLDGTLQFSVVEQDVIDPRAYPRAGIRMSINPDTMIAGGRTSDARLMRFDEEQGTWLRAVRAINDIEQADIRFMPGREMGVDAKLGHYGNYISDTDSYVWAVVDTNSMYAVGVMPDLDDDGVADTVDECAESLEELFVSPNNGCTLEQECPCGDQGEPIDIWKNHGNYVSCMAQAAEVLLEFELISADEKDVIVSEAAQSNCGRK